MKKEKERIICAIPKGDIYHNTVNTDEKIPAGQGESNLQAELSEKAAGQPEAEDCSIDIMNWSELSLQMIPALRNWETFPSAGTM